MREITGLAKIKVNYATRLKLAIKTIRLQVLPCNQKVFDQFLSLVGPGYAYDSIGAYKLDWIPDINQDRTRTEHKLAVVSHEIGKAILEYYTLIRTDDQVGLEYLVQRLENYAECGFNECELLGGPDCGYGLFDPRQQT